MSEDLISRQWLLEEYDRRHKGPRGGAYQMILDAPSAQPERTGRWVESNPKNSEICRLINCSECGKGYIVNINVPYEDWTDAHKFCVECGAKMEVEHEAD